MNAIHNVTDKMGIDNFIVIILQIKIIRKQGHTLCRIGFAGCIV